MVESTTSRSKLPALLLFSLLLTGLAGCSRGPSKQQVLAAINEAKLHGFPCSQRQITSFTATELTAGESWHVKLRCEEQRAEPWMIEVDTSKATQTNPPTVAEMKLLRSPESELVRQTYAEIKQFRFPTVFREVFATGSTASWNGNGTLKRVGDKLTFEQTSIEFPGVENLKTLLPKSKLPADAAIADGSNNDPLKRYSALQQKLVEQVKSAKRQMQARLAKEHQAIEQLVANRQSLQGTLTLGASVGTEFHMIFDGDSAGETSLSAALIAQDDPFSRIVMNGATKLVEVDSHEAALRNVHDGWMVVLQNADPRLSDAARLVKSTTLYYDTSREQFRMSIGGKPATAWMPVGSTESMKPDSLLPMGTVMTGYESVTGESDREIILTVVAVDEIQSNLRVIVEDASSGFTFAVYEGKVRRQAPHHLGIPIRLKRVDTASDQRYKAKKSGLFDHGRDTSLLLLPRGGEWLGRTGVSQLTFSKSRHDKQVQPARARWQTALKPGHQWDGTMQWQNDAVEEVTMQVADVSENGGYARLTLAKKADLFQFVVYEGALLLGDGRADGYGLSMEQTGVASYTDREYYGVFFSSWQHTDKKLFRLSPDGLTIRGVTTQGQQLTLTRNADISPTNALQKERCRQSWEKALTPGKVWPGLLTDRAKSQTAEVEFVVLTNELAGKKIQVEIRLAKLPSVKAIYEGSLDPSQAALNGYALTLTNAGGADTKSIVISNFKGFKLEFRLEPDGKRLIGRTPYASSSTTGSQKYEYLDLRSK